MKNCKNQDHTELQVRDVKIIINRNYNTAEQLGNTMKQVVIFAGTWLLLTILVQTSLIFNQFPSLSYICYKLKQKKKRCWKFQTKNEFYTLKF